MCCSKVAKGVLAFTFGFVVASFFPNGVAVVIISMILILLALALLKC